MSKALARWRITTNVFPKPSYSLVNGVNLRRALVAHGHRAHKNRPYSTIQPSLQHTASYRPQADAFKNLEDLPELAAHLSKTFSPLQFSPELAARILTHQSHQHASVSNNNRLSFIGRRVLNTYLLLFLHSTHSAQEPHEYDLIASNALNTYVLGEHVAPKWELPSIMKWKAVGPDVDVQNASQLGRDASRSIGLYKVSGTTVEAVVGGVFHQFGGNVAHRLFHTRLLPHILLPGSGVGLHDAFHPQALKICRRMGGPQAKLIDANGQIPHTLDSTL